MELEERGEGEKRRGTGMLFLCRVPRRINCTCHNISGQRRERSRKPRLAWDLLMDQYGLRERKGDHVIGLQLITSLRCFPPASNRRKGGGRMDDGVTTPRVGLTARRLINTSYRDGQYDWFKVPAFPLGGFAQPIASSKSLQ